jgi:hypothetical protein
MTRFLAAVLTLAALLAVAAPAGAADPLTVKSSTPADGARVPLTPTGGIPWQITAAGVPADAEVSVTISSTGAIGGDGVTLSTADRADFFVVSSDAPGSWSGRSDPGPNAWSATAGTYFWQVIATWTDAGGVFHQAVSGVARLFLGVAPPPAATTTPRPGAAQRRTTLRMSSADATFYVRSVIRLRTKRAPARLRFGCARVATRTYRCRPTWRDSRNSYTATASFTHIRSGGRVVTRATVTGRRASLQCVRQRSFSQCAQRFRWRATLAARPVTR